MSLEPLCDPVLIDCGVAHGFGQRGSQVPDLTWFPKQVHGVSVATAGTWAPGEAPAADAIVSTHSAAAVGIVTADCVPILLATEDGRQVGAIHAGWRGLAAGVIEAAVSAFQAQARDSGHKGLVAAVGPAARACCYEVDPPVRDALARIHSSRLDASVLAAGRAGHYQLDLPLLATRILEEIGGNSTQVGTAHRTCTVCGGERFESYRRDGTAAGRLRHFIRASHRDLGQG